MGECSKVGSRRQGMGCAPLSACLLPVAVLLIASWSSQSSTVSADLLAGTSGEMLCRVLLLGLARQ